MGQTRITSLLIETCMMGSKVSVYFHDGLVKMAHWKIKNLRLGGTLSRKMQNFKPETRRRWTKLFTPHSLP